MTCHLCRDLAIAVFHLSHGCVCSPCRLQPLCPQHAVRATPLGGMELIEDLTDGGFGAWWKGVAP